MVYVEVCRQLKVGDVRNLSSCSPAWRNEPLIDGWCLSYLRFRVNALRPNPRFRSQHMLANLPDSTSSLNPIADPHHCVLPLSRGQCHGGVGVDMYIIIYPNTDNNPKLENRRESCHGGQNFYQYGAVEMANSFKGGSFKRRKSGRCGLFCFLWMHI